MARLLLALGAPAVLLLAGELLLRAAGFGHPTTFFLPHATEAGILVENPAFGRRFFPPGLLRVPPPTRFARAKQPGSLRILLFGESAAMGDPKPAYGAARYLEVLLRERHPDTRFEVIPVAMTAINSHALLAMARECRSLQADYWLVYAGNNEMLGPFGAGSALGGSSAPWPLVRLILAAKATRLGQAIETLSTRFRARPTGSSRWAGLRILADEAVAGDAPARRQVYEAFDRNLRDLVRAGQSSGAQVLLGTVAVNLRDCGPFGSAHQPPLDPARLAEWTATFDRLRAGRTNVPGLDTREVGPWVALSPHHAAAQFLWGEALLVATNTPAGEALTAFARARDLDTIPLRSDTREEAIVRQVATDLGAGLVDTASALAAASLAGIPGNESFYEHVHLTPEGNYRVARAYAEALEPGLPEAIRATARPDWASPEACATRLALTPWNRGAAAEMMLRRCLDAPFTNRLNHLQHLEALALEVQRQRRSQTPAAAGFLRAVYTNAVAAAPEDHHLRRGYAEFLEATGDLPAATEQWQQIALLLPHHPVAHLQAGSLLRRAGRIDDARPLIEKAVALQPDWVEARLELAELLLARGRPQESLQACREALALEPDHARAHLRLADALAASRQSEAAVRSLEEAVRLDPRLWEARYLLGVEYALLERVAEARLQFEEVVRLKPDHARGQFNLGIALARQQQWQAAAIHLAEALRLDPRNEEAKQALAQIAAITRQASPAPPP